MSERRELDGRERASLDQFVAVGGSTPKAPGTQRRQVVCPNRRCIQKLGMLQGIKIGNAPQLALDLVKK